MLQMMDVNDVRSVAFVEINFLLDFFFYLPKFVKDCLGFVLVYFVNQCVSSVGLKTDYFMIFKEGITFHAFETDLKVCIVAGIHDINYLVD
jgi:hypothetical protein